VTQARPRAVPQGVRALTLCVLVISLAALAAAVQPAHACSCAVPDPRSALAAADGAFVGRLVSRRESDAQAILTFEVERPLKGAIGETIEVRTASNGAACGIEAPIGTRVGLALERRDGAWHGHLCAQFSPSDLIAAAAPLPAPNGTGPAALVVGGRFGTARVIALDRQARTLAYGRGGGTTMLLSSCPGNRRMAEVTSLEAGWTLALRERRTLHFVRAGRLRIPAGLVPSAIACEDSLGTSVLVFARAADDSGRARLVRVARSGQTVLWAGTATSVAMIGHRAYLATGKRGTMLVALDLETRRTRIVGHIPPFAGTLAPSPDGKRLAGVAYSAPEPGAPGSRTVLIDLERTPARVHTSPLGSPNVSGDVVWLSNGRLAMFPSGEIDVIHVYDTSLHVRARVPGWSARGAALVGTSVYGIGWDGRLLRAKLPAGPVRIARRLPSPVAYAIVAA
jgi:hypothetical protein